MNIHEFIEQTAKALEVRHEHTPGYDPEETHTLRFKNRSKLESLLASLKTTVALSNAVEDKGVGSYSDNSYLETAHEAIRKNKLDPWNGLTEEARERIVEEGAKAIAGAIDNPGPWPYKTVFPKTLNKNVVEGRYNNTRFPPGQTCIAEPEFIWHDEKVEWWSGKKIVNGVEIIVEKECWDSSWVEE